MRWPARWFRTHDRGACSRDRRAVYPPSRQGLDLAGQLAPALQNGRKPEWAICAEPPTLMVQEAGVPIRRSGAFLEWPGVL